MVEQYRERLTGSMDTPANDGTGLGPSGAAGKTSGTLMACTVAFAVLQEMAEKRVPVSPEVSAFP